MPKLIPKDRWQEIIHKAIGDGKTQRKIAEILGCSPASVSIFMQKHGMETLCKKGPRRLIERRARPLEAQLRELAEVKRYGAEDIGPKIGVTPSTARRYLEHLGIDFPTNGRTVFKYDTTGWDKVVLTARRKGKTNKEIAVMLGCSEVTVYRWLANNGHIKVADYRRG